MLNVGIAHDLTSQQCKAVKKVLQEAREQCDQEDQTGRDDPKLEIHRKRTNINEVLKVNRN